MGKSTKDIIPIDDDGLLVNYEHIVMLDSRFVANAFDKKHQHVMEAVRKLIKDEPEFGLSKIRQSSNHILVCRKFD